MWTSKTVVSRCVQQVVTAHRQVGPAIALHTSSVRSDSNKTSIVRCGREKYERLYPVILVQPDGSTINIRYREPRRILMMPVDITTLSEEERKARLKKRSSKKDGAQKEEILEDHFKVEDYSQFWKK